MELKTKQVMWYWITIATPVLFVVNVVVGDRVFAAPLILLFIISFIFMIYYANKVSKIVMKDIEYKHSFYWVLFAILILAVFQKIVNWNVYLEWGIWIAILLVVMLATL